MDVLTAINPSTGEVAGEVAVTPLTACVEMVEKSRQAFADWSRKPIKERIALLRRLREGIIEQLDDLVDVIVTSTGKPAVEALRRMCWWSSICCTIWKPMRKKFWRPNR